MSNNLNGDSDDIAGYEGNNNGNRQFIAAEGDVKNNTEKNPNSNSNSNGNLLNESKLKLNDEVIILENSKFINGRKDQNASAPLPSDEGFKRMDIDDDDLESAFSLTTFLKKNDEYDNKLKPSIADEESTYRRTKNWYFDTPFYAWPSIRRKVKNRKYPE